MRVLQKLGFCLDNQQKRETPPATNNTGATTTKRVSVIATDRDRAYFLRQKNMRNNKNSAEKRYEEPQGSSSILQNGWFLNSSLQVE
ncbi:Protein CBG26417 [Caenorhabditis briggsae]|uniref:Protein CBG26417 n=1 Tax=Caenorhabditis briggsae TaxID=6238 RepID=B6ILF0_CAEBR|nr:Protein CBG26417 [Caenorhabditis briggsae]CAS00730.1 Protein CBG26417 [Caenorhabditis briggsae]